MLSLLDGLPPLAKARTAGLFYLLTFVAGSLALLPLVESWFPYNLAPGIVGEGILTLWLLFAGVDVRRWHEQAGTMPLRGHTA